MLDLIAVLSKEIIPLPRVEHRPDRGFDVPINILDSSRLRQETGWRPGVGFEEGVRRTIQWLKERTSA